MQLDNVPSQAAMLEMLTRAAEAAWGAERLEALGPLLDASAAALWVVAQERLDFADAEPDFIGGAER
jgi:hypothetical protein